MIRKTTKRPHAAPRVGRAWKSPLVFVLTSAAAYSIWPAAGVSGAPDTPAATGGSTARIVSLLYTVNNLGYTDTCG